MKNNLEIRRDYCRTCRLYGEAIKVDEMYDCTVCYDGLKKGREVSHIVEKYKIRRELK